MGDKSRWTTSCELTFLRGIGHHREGMRTEARPKLSRVELLKNYRRTIKDRDKWGDVNPVTVRRIADELLEREAGSG